jgi:alpha-D-ribose 1-methylphosphonate 5-triphosphate diphosphatase PhnM
MTAGRKVRIGCASAFYGDSQLAARQLVEKGKIDYLVFDYLAETTMAILSRARARNADLGYAVDFVTVAMHDVLADCAMQVTCSPIARCKGSKSSQMPVA